MKFFFDHNWGLNISVSNSDPEQDPDPGYKKPNFRVSKKSKKL